MNTFYLKLIAVITMLIDHIAAVFVTDPKWYEVLRGIGRLSFPIFAFLIVEGFFYTSNVYKYMVRLAVFAILSEIPYDLAFYGTIYYPKHQNIFFTLLIGLVVMYLLTLINSKFSTKTFLKAILSVIIVVVGCVIAQYSLSDYTAGGILMILIYYYFRGNKGLILLGLLYVNGILFRGIQTIAAASIVFLWFYNGKKGPSMKYFFYIFYPAHLLLLYLLKQYI